MIDPMRSAVAICLLLFAAPAVARDDGRYANVDPEIKKWIEGLTDKSGNGCCSTADGAPLNGVDVVWDTDTGKYRVRIDGEWVEVTDHALIEKPNKIGAPIVWYKWSFDLQGKRTITIRCFIPGAQG